MDPHIIIIIVVIIIVIIIIIIMMIEMYSCRPWIPTMIA